MEVSDLFDMRHSHSMTRLSWLALSLPMAVSIAILRCIDMPSNAAHRMVNDKVNQWHMKGMNVLFSGHCLSLILAENSVASLE